MVRFSSDLIKTKLKFQNKFQQEEKKLFSLKILNKMKTDFLDFLPIEGQSQIR